MTRFLEIIMEKEFFSQQTATEFIHALGENNISENEIAAIITAIQFRGVSIDEINGFRIALLERAIQPELDTTDSIDVCGTGGDGKETFNISTTTALVLAAMGHKVIKHGNYGVSSGCGSSNVLESLGFSFSNDQKTLQSHFKAKNICFLHAPLFHPTLKKVAPIRKNLGVRTIFNSLGPLVNPLQPPFQLTGTYSLELAKMYQHILRPNRHSFRVVYAMDGYDEITLTDTARQLGTNSDSILTASDFGTKPLAASALRSGGTIKKAASILLDTIKGQGAPEQSSVVAANVALAMQIIRAETPLNEAYSEAYQFIQSGQTAKHFNLFL